jgi:hypothetical protein
MSKREGLEKLRMGPDEVYIRFKFGAPRSFQTTGHISESDSNGNVIALS